MSSNSTRTYESAISALNALQTNASLLEVLRKSRDQMNKRSLPEMRDYIRRLGYNVSDFNSINAIHVAGTKGKGSTSAFLESIIRHSYGSGSDGGGIKTGMFTSPHLIEVRERIKINGEPLSKSDFTRYFYEVYDKLESSCPKPPTPPATNDHPMPQYFRFLTLMALHVFKMEKVNAAIVEVGIGGEYDATNVIESPAVCVITALGFDHQSILGQTIEEIAWHKSGIFKRGSGAVSASQQWEGAMEVIRKRAGESGSLPLKVAPPLDSFVEFQERPEYFDKLGLEGVHQRQNAAVAIVAFRKWQQRVFGSGDEELMRLTDKELKGLFNVKWPGRAQVIADHSHSNIRYFLDGAHTQESVSVCIDWFSKYGLNGSDESENILIFNCTMGRSAEDLLKPICEFDRKKPFKHLIITSNNPYSAKTEQQKKQGASDLVNNMVDADPNMNTQKQISKTWYRLSNKNTSVSICSSVSESIELARMLSRNGVGVGMPHNVLVTGSLHLVGSMLSVMGEPVQ